MTKKATNKRQPFADDQSDQGSTVVPGENATNEADGAEVYQVEHLLAERWSEERKEMIYLVKWEDYSEEQ